MWITFELGRVASIKSRRDSSNFDFPLRRMPVMTLISGTPIRLVKVSIYDALLMSFIGILLWAASVIPQN